MEYYFQIRSLITCCLLCYLFICMHVLALRFLILQYVSCMLTTSLGQKESEWGLKTFSVRVVWNMALRDKKHIYGKLITRNPGSIRKWTPRQSLKRLPSGSAFWNPVRERSLVIAGVGQDFMSRDDSQALYYCWWPHPLSHWQSIFYGPP